jgi:hypothetical protein
VEPVSLTGKRSVRVACGFVVRGGERLVCSFCGQVFTSPPGRRGPAPRYCSQAHRQRAYEARRRQRSAVTRDDELIMLRSQVAQLRSHQALSARKLEEARKQVHELLADQQVQARVRRDEQAERDEAERATPSRWRRPGSRA